MLQNLLRKQQQRDDGNNNASTMFKSLFSKYHTTKNNNVDDNDDDENNSLHNSPTNTIPQLSPLANSVVARCSKILKISTQELQHRFDSELPESVKQLLSYARNFIEFCSYQTVALLIQRSPNYLSDPSFSHLTFDMMLAWDSPTCHAHTNYDNNTDSYDKDNNNDYNYDYGDDDDNNYDDDAEGGWSLFYSPSTKTAVEVDDKKTVGSEAFARIAPASPAIADVITVHNLFDALTTSSGKRLHFLMYAQYLRSLDKVIKTAKIAAGTSVSNLQLAKGEVILDIDGIVPIQPVLQHVGISAWPGRLTLTNYALYFESGVGLYDKAIRYDLAMDMKQVIKPELTGPLGTRLFDRAVMYKSTSIEEPVYFEFPEFKGNVRRDYWLDICREILYAHKFIRKKNLKSSQLSEVLARSILGIFRCRAVREAFHIFSSNFKTLLSFNLAENLPGGDTILDILHSRLTSTNASSPKCATGSTYPKQQTKMHCPYSLIELHLFGITLTREILDDKDFVVVGDVAVGEMNPLEMAVKRSISCTHRAEVAKATVDKVKVEGIDTNIAVLKELMLPVIKLVFYVRALASWKNRLNSSAFLLLSCYAIIRGWVRYILPSIFSLCAILMFSYRLRNIRKPVEAFKITLPADRNTVEQLVTIQEALTQLEALTQDGNIILLKIRALLYAVMPQATNRVALVLVLMAAMFIMVPQKYIILLIYVEGFTREMPLRKRSSDKISRRIREWWVRIPAAPVQLIKIKESKKRK